MNPLFLINLDEFSPNEILHSYWKTQSEEYHQIKVYLSTMKQFDVRSFLSSDDVKVVDTSYDNENKVVLLWDDLVEIQDDVTNMEIKKELVLSVDNKTVVNREGRNIVINETVAKTWFHKEEDLFENSWIIQGLRSVSGTLSSMFHSNTEDKSHAEVIKISRSSPIWKALHANRTVYIHALVIRHSTKPKPQSDLTDRMQVLQKQYSSHSIVSGQVDMIKRDAPISVKPKRILYHDLVYFYHKVLGRDVIAPWDFSKTTSKQTIHEYTDYITTDRKSVV